MLSIENTLNMTIKPLAQSYNYQQHKKSEHQTNVQKINVEVQLGKWIYEYYGAAT